MSQIEDNVRARLSNNGRNPANKNAGILVGSDLHYCEMLLAVVDRLRSEKEALVNALKRFADANGCGCKPVCLCDTVEHLRIWKEEAQSDARAAIRHITDMKDDLK